MTTPLLAELYENAKPGCCIICDGRIGPRKSGPGRKRYVHAGECYLEYLRLYCAAWRAVRVPMSADAVPARGEFA